MPSYSTINTSGKVEFSVSGMLASVTAMTNGSMRDLQETVLRVSYNILLDPDMLINFIITSLFSPYPLLFVNGGTT